MNTEAALPIDRTACVECRSTQDALPNLSTSGIDRPSRDAGAVISPRLLTSSTYPHGLRPERATADGLMAVAADNGPACVLRPSSSHGLGIGAVDGQ